MRRFRHWILTAGATAYLGWRTASVIAAPSPANVVFLVVETLGWIGLGSFLLTISSSRHPVATDPSSPAPLPVVAVLAGGCSPSALDRSLASLEPFPSLRRLVVVDPKTGAGALDAIRSVAAAADTVVVTTERSGLGGALDTLLHRLDDQDALVLVRGGSLLTAEGLNALTAPMRDPAVGGVQGGLGWADGSKLALHGPGRDGLALFMEREAPAAGAAGVAPLVGDGTALRVRALRAVGTADRDLGVALAAGGWLSRFASQTVVCRPRPASSAGWRIERTAELADRRRRAIAALRAPGLRLTSRLRVVAAAGDVASALARVGLVVSVVTMLVSGRVPVPGSTGRHLLFGGAIWGLGVLATRAAAGPVLRVGDRLRLGWRRLDADALAVVTRAVPGAGPIVRLGRLRALAWFPLSVIALLAIDLAGVLRGLAFIHPQIVGSTTTPADRATIGVASILVLALLVDALRVFVGRPDARGDLRIRSGLRVEVTGPRFGALAEIVDLSSTGAGLTAAGPVEVGDRLQLRFSLPDATLVEAGAVVSRIAGAGSEQRVGVRFEALAADTRRSLVRYVAATATTTSSRPASDTGFADAHLAAVTLPRPLLRFFSVVAVVVTSASLVVSPAGAAPLSEAIVTGVVSGPDGPAGEVCVNAVSDSWQWYGTQTATDGSYSLAAPADSYRVQFRDCRATTSGGKLLTSWWSPSGPVPESGAEHIQLAEGEERTGIDATLQFGGTFAGSLETPDGTLFDGGCVNPVSVSTNSWDGGTSTPDNGVSGRFETDALTAGQYRIHLSDCSGQTQPFAQGWVGADGSHLVASQDDARIYDLDVSGVDVGTLFMTTGTRLAGTVRDDTGAPVSGICIGVDSPNWQWAGGGTTDQDGHYLTDPILPGTWVIQLNDCRQPATLVNTFWTGTDAPVNDINAATPIQLDGSVSVADGYDQTMVRGGTISGIVTTDNGPASGACVNAVVISGNSGSWLAGTQTASDGTFRLGPVAGNNVAIQVDGCQATGMIGGVYAGPGQPLTNAASQAFTFTVSADNPVENLVLHAELGATVSGMVTAGGAPLADACIAVLDPDTGFAQSSRTGSDGLWSVTVQSGSYLVDAYDCVQGRGRAGRFATDATDPAQATRIIAVGGQVHAPVNIELPAAAPSSIRGRVVTASGAVPTACVVVVVPNQEPIAVVPTGPDGTFEIGTIDAGSYLLGIAGCDFGGDMPPGVTDPVDPSITYPLQWSSGVALDVENIWLNPPWVTAHAGATTELGTICLSPCNAPTPPAPPSIDVSAPDPVTPDVLGADLFDPDGFDVAGAPTVDPPAPTGSVAQEAIDSIAPRSDAEGSGIAAGSEASDQPSGPAANPPTPNHFADAATAGGETSSGGSANGWWVFVGAGILGLGAVLFPKVRARRLT